MTKVLCSKKYWCLAVALILFMITAFPAAAFADENGGSADNSQDTETTGPASDIPPVQDYSPPASEAPASTDYVLVDSPLTAPPQDLPAPSDSVLSGAADPEMEPFTANETDTPATGNSYIAKITPDAVVNGGTIPVDYTGYKAGEANKSFTVKFTEVGDKQIGSAQVGLPFSSTNPGDPHGFKDFSFDPVTGIITSSGQNWTGELVFTAGQYYLNLWAQNAADYLANGESVSATFTATTPTINGIYKFDTSAWTNAAAGFDGIGTVINNRAVGYDYSPFVIVGTGVGTPEDLLAIQGDEAKFSDSYVQTDDIDLSGYGDDEKGWQPLYLQGAYNGNGKTISNLYINRTDSDSWGIGLFSNIGYTLLTNIKLDLVNITGRGDVGALAGYVSYALITNCSATGSVKGTNQSIGGLLGYSKYCTITDSYSAASVEGPDYDVGGLVGASYRTLITNCSASGNINGRGGVGGLVGTSASDALTGCRATGSVSGGNSVGGLVGRNVNGTITKCYATGSVEGVYYIGGLVGYNGWSDGKIAYSFATGDAKGGDYVGGLVGVNAGEVTNCYSTGAVSGNIAVGGLVGSTGLHPETVGLITNCYSTGAVSGDSEVGGLVGSSYSNTISNCYFNTDTISQDNGVVYSISDGVTGLTTVQMKNIASYLDWHITTTTLTVNRGGLYPYPFPRLFWELGIGNSPIWYIYDCGEEGDGGNPGNGGGEEGDGGNPGNDGGEEGDGGHPGSNGTNFGGNLGFAFGFTLAPAPDNSPGGLTRIPRQVANAAITPAFVTGGSATDLGKAITAFNQAQRSYETNKGTMSAADNAVAVTELAIADAAIKALALSLAAQGGQTFDLVALISAYNIAVAVLDANRALLTVEQIAEAEALLQAIAAVISRFST